MHQTIRGLWQSTWRLGSSPTLRFKNAELDPPACNRKAQAWVAGPAGSHGGCPNFSVPRPVEPTAAQPNIGQQKQARFVGD
ncbi:hypothetical protein N656DRAFT_562109 [Canariomyces notabilis]|uniref:Uncharacterized protein n=1 Tax=Canariomyces notabilis TaxID=2074819 RepID=A0AAN6QCH5_9PEZI|nr:hypothetical protein N656DRAFT_562109 [Canariomyces arenarius]